PPGFYSYFERGRLGLMVARGRVYKIVGFWQLLAGLPAPTELLRIVKDISLISHSAPFSYIL
ncbi:hypothetical protein, partial [Microcoleus sp. AT13-A5]|uniref:hypothetical protein n=1 Tax=Microcoleus sp. AT13-A5 TaxID=2818590 RepID=UPI002FD21832